MPSIAYWSLTIAVLKKRGALIKFKVIETIMIWILLALLLAIGLSRYFFFV